MPPLPDPAPIDTDAFSAGLLDPERAAPPHVTGPNGKGAVKRYNVYRNNVTVSLIDALADIFPAVLKLTGENFFRAMAREHVRAHPPRSPLLFRYGRDFADFIAAFEPARPLPYLADVARAERAWLTAYHAADAAPLDPAELAAIPADQIAGARFAAHPAFAVITSPFPVFRIFSMNRDLMDLAPVKMDQAEAILVTRPADIVTVSHLTPAGARFADALAQGLTLGEAAGLALETDPAFDLNGALTALLSAGAFAAVAASDDGGD
ncbi:MAG: putative DNA-binding domain-containing protein [Roseitalea sp.]|jgi:hypothetical protein|nr:putative DNA-binding domain-containing protein [Roseitalea sp.]MBO6723791.1 putative DNA-binding domain-containing protein [Roseitalea sp.]MBO6741921.1 putative DNA-binding domain-containing protein [Roseitalea sp.]